MNLSAETYLGFHLDEDLIRFWQERQWHPYGDFDYFRQEYHSDAPIQYPYLLTVKRQNEILSCLIGKIQPLPLKLQFGYRICYGPPLTTLIVHRSGLIGNWQEAVCRFVMERMRHLLSAGTIDAVLFRMIPLASPLHRIACSMVPPLQRDHFPITQEYWILNQVQSFEKFLKSHTHIKSTFKKHAHRLEASLGNNAHVKCYSDSDELQLMLRHSEEVSAKTWQRKLGDVSFTDPEVRSLYRFYLEKGWGRIFILYIDGLPVSYLHGIVYRNVLYALKKGYDPSWRHLGVGTYLLMHVIRKCCETADIRQIDFNVGNSEDKRRYCDSSFHVSDIHLFGPAIRLRALNALRLAAQGSHQLAKSLLHRLGWYQSIRKRWRYGA